MDDMQGDVQAVLDRLIESGAERGLQVAVYRNGEQVVEAVAGVADAETGRLVTASTPFFATSTGKGVTATVVHVLAERGVLDYDTPIVELWPEFGAHGKEGATLQHALTHSTGVPGLPVATQPEDFLDWDGMCALIADAEPWWEPGTATGYHAQTFGWIVGEIVRRVTGKRISQVLHDEVAGPLGVADELFFGVPPTEMSRLARLEDPVPAASGDEQPPALPSPGAPDGWVWAPPATAPVAAFGNRADLLAADIPATGTMTARAVARMYAALMHDVDGVRLISESRLREATALAVEGVDAVFSFPVQRGLGYAVGGLGGVFEGPAVFGMPGSGGTAAFADRASGTAVAVLKNRNTIGDFTTMHQVSAAVAKRL
ncbi:serine hydrolase domain-containing protein [Pseudonocardia yunnanensis]|uniref:Serine hydrolase domain-containing protein n=1 Tax=Pseudonocardia yunnanensis TaxID=58107 RepID=A0ABW4FEL7_9PSEU